MHWRWLSMEASHAYAWTLVHLRFLAPERLRGLSTVHQCITTSSPALQTLSSTLRPEVVEVVVVVVVLPLAMVVLS